MMVSASPSVLPRSSTMPMKLRPSRRFMVFPVFLVRVGFRVVDHSLEVDHHGGLVADHPGIVAGGRQRDVARTAVELGAVVHGDPQHAGDVILEVGRLAALRPGERLHRGRPFPARLEHRAAHGRAADADQFDPPLRKLANLVGLAEVLAFGLLHAALLSVERMRYLKPARSDRKCVGLRRHSYSDAIRRSAAVSTRAASPKERASIIAPSSEPTMTRATSSGDPLNSRLPPLRPCSRTPASHCSLTSKKCLTSSFIALGSVA